jgi:GntP family gluconate:H+ symporter
MPIEFVFIIAIAIILFMTFKLKVNAFIALITASLAMGLLSGMEPVAVVDTITAGFSKTIKNIGIIIIFGIMLGNYLEASKGTTKLAIGTVRMVGEKKSSLAMAVAGYIISIPVFSDAGFIILAPLVKAIARKTKIARAVLAVSLSAGLLATHVYVPPTPGPLAAAGMLGIDIGRAIFYGSIAAVFMTLGGWIFAELFLKSRPDTFYSYKEDIVESDDVDLEETNLPTFFSSVMPLLLPIMLILSNTTAKMLFAENAKILEVTSFIGNPNIALMLGTALGILLLYNRIGKSTVLKVMDNSLKESGTIIFITAAGGALGEILKVSGAGASLANLVVNLGIPFILIPFLIAAVFTVVQGSGTVAVVTAATLAAPIGVQLGIDPILIFLASGAGARAPMHVNCSFFWVYANYMGFDTKTALKTLTLSNIFMSLGGLLATFIISLWV